MSKTISKTLTMFNKHAVNLSHVDLAAARMLTVVATSSAMTLVVTLITTKNQRDLANHLVVPKNKK